MNAEERAWLYEVAGAATPGPWELEAAEVWTAEFGHLVAVASRLADADFIAAASPDVVRELIDTLNASEAERGRLAAAVERVRALHVAYYPFQDGRGYCGTCEGDEFVPYPCSTISALDATPETGGES